MGIVIAPLPEQCGTNAKAERASSEWTIKRGGGGYPPATLCVRAFSRESLDPPPGIGREPTPQVLTCGGPRRDHLPTAEAPGPAWEDFPPPGRRAPRGAAPRGTVRAPTTCRVCTTGDSGPAPPSGVAGRRSQTGPPTDSRGPRPHLEGPLGLGPNRTTCR